VQRQMTCGGQFNGQQLRLDMSCLRFYSGKAQKLLEACAASPLPAALVRR
jgi:hypothetical protein